MCSWVKMETHWVSVIWCQSKKQPAETGYLHLSLGANKVTDELTADGVKALRVEIVFFTVRRKAGTPVGFLYFCFTRFLSCQSLLLLASKGKVTQAVQPTRLPWSAAVWFLVQKAVICVKPDSSIRDRYKLRGIVFTDMYTRSTDKATDFNSIIIWLCHI